MGQVREFKNPVAGVLAALKEYDLNEFIRLNKWIEADTEKAIYEAEAYEKAEEYKVQYAFWELTKEYNILDNCLRIDVERIREIVGAKANRFGENIPQ